MKSIVERAKEIAHGDEGEFRSATVCRLAQAVIDFAEALEFCSKSNVGFQAVPYEINAKARAALQKHGVKAGEVG